jgi:hypothetical protein
VGKVNIEDQHLKIEYSMPFPGIDTTALAPYIQGLFDAENFLIRNNSYVVASWKLLTFGDQSTFDTNSFLIGFGELAFPVAGPMPANLNDKFFYLTINTAANAIGFASDTIDAPSTNIGSVALSGIPTPGTLTWKTINQTTYLSADGMSQILQIAIDPTTSIPALTLLTSYLGCKFLGEFNGRLIAMYVNQLQIGPPPFVQSFPYQIAWSAGGEQYGIWNPLDLSGNATGAGFNNLPDVEDEITGALFIGPTVYIIRRAGISEMTPLNSGIQPFNFDHMWASHKGVGTVFPYTIAQYGPKGCFVANDDIYSIGLDGIAQIGGSAKRAIYTDLMASNFNIQAGMAALIINGTPELCYFLGMQLDSNISTNNFIRVYIYGFETKQWMRLTITNGTTFPAVPTQTLIGIISLLLSNISSTFVPDNVSFDGIVMAAQAANEVPTFWTIPILPSNPVTIGSTTESKLVFPQERIQTLKDVTIDAVLFYAEGMAGSKIQATVDGVPFTLQTLGTGPDSAKNIYTAYPDQQASLTTLQPQLTVECQGTIALGEISMYGTVGQGRRP